MDLKATQKHDSEHTCVMEQCMYIYTHLIKYKVTTTNEVVFPISLDRDYSE